ncbi:MAG: transcription elongation factor GreA [Patescibacteria group bacterium]|nr:transcription elongation factor GreA [Patescibacteria group bacterium]MDE1988573.1 transcription elongation factor GreA [Patescibacteria group bacterium]MDE2218174.1 transcription elongation factor GreA [Patescibacteria group bacterium]
MDNKEHEYLTKEKYEELVRELDNLKKVKRKEVAESLEYAKSLGDLSENAEYQEAREWQANIEDRIAKLESILKSAEIVSSYHGDIVSIGSTVTIQKKGETTNKVFKVVGSEEADMNAGKLSNRSPIGAAMMGKKKGETFSYSAPNGIINCKIIDVK